MKKIIAMLLALVMVLGLAACATKTEPAQPKRPPRLRRPTPRPPKNPPLLRPRRKNPPRPKRPVLSTT